MKRIIINIIFIFLPLLVIAQQHTNKKEIKDQKHIRSGVKKYESADYADAEKGFRKALAENPVSDIAAYDLGRNHLEQDKSLEAAYNFERAAKNSDDKNVKNKAWYNAGNIWFHKKKYEKAVEAYKNSLRNNPDDEEARYNLALAKKMLKKQQNKNRKNKQKNKQNKNQKNKQNKKQQDNKNKDKNKNKDNKQPRQQKGDKDKDKKNKKDKSEQNKNRQNKPKEQPKNKPDKKENQQQKPSGASKREKNRQMRKSKLSPQQVKQLLIGLKNKEMKTQKKVKAKAVKLKKKKQEKDW